MSGNGLYSAAEFRRRAALQAEKSLELSWQDYAEHRMNPDWANTLDTLDLRDAAVLIPVVDDGDDARVIFTQRTAKLRKHSGQVAFPGGAIDAADGGPEAAAMREAAEEIGLDPFHVEPIGQLPVYRTFTGFRITPILSVVNPGFTLVPNPDEVDAIFDVPLSFLMNPDNHGIESRVWQGAERFYYSMPYEDRLIWGITAGIVRALYERLYQW